MKALLQLPPSPHQCPIVHGEVRGKVRAAHARLSQMGWEDGVCDDLSSSGFKEVFSCQFGCKD